MRLADLAELTGDFRMEDWNHLKSEFLWAYEGAVAAPYRDTTYHQPGQSALLIEQGSLLVETEKGAVRADRGQWIFPRLGRRLQQFSDAARVLSVHFNLYWPGGQSLFDWDVALVFEAAAAPRLEKATRALVRLVARRMPGATVNLHLLRAGIQTHFALQRAFTAWLCVFVEAMLNAGAAPSRLGPIDQRVLDVVRNLDALSLGTTFDERQLAAAAGLSPRQMDRLFSRQFDLTPRQYFEQRKLERAAELIHGTPLSIKQIAYELGFSSLPHFSRWFGQKTGFSPRQFKKHNSSVQRKARPARP